ncbi:ABC transporter permease [Bifidobacterium amazonense]|uniref:ABC transporter permease n=1 Tax=Bifidobacterium amazonense TaxID=2809027 RepID=A0ABS9VS46_9BIFI|nr:methionine ABC transporter permease [Bifidobacterium amazonense]MCH9274906.1 ABC transporter permease [Bifidobacterium amazonense]
MSLLTDLFPNVSVRMDEFYDATLQTIWMILIVSVVSFVLSLALALLLTTSKPGGLSPNAVVFQIVDKLTNFFRSIPFIILATTMIPLTRFLVGTAIGLRGAVVPLIVGITPFFTRQIESAFMNVDPGVVEASVSMGLSKPQIVWAVYLRESIPQIAKVTSITVIHLLALTAVIGVVGGGGLGDFAIRYGFQRYMFDASVAVILVYLVFIYIVETTGKLIIASTTHE